MASLACVIQANHRLGVSNINHEQQAGLRNNTSEEVAPQTVEPSCDSGSLDDGLPQPNLHVYEKTSCAGVSRYLPELFRAGRVRGLSPAPNL